MSAPSPMARPPLVDDLLPVLRAREAALRAAGIRRLSVFGSVARGTARADSDVDLAVELEPAAHVDLVTLSALERELAEWPGHPVDLLVEPVEKPGPRTRIDRDRRLVF